MIIEEGLIAIGILALIAAIFLLRGKGKTSQPKQQVIQKPAVDKQVMDFAGPSVSPKAQTAPFPAPQVPFPVSAGGRQTIGFAEQNTQNTQISFPVSQVPFPGSGSGNRQVAGFVEPTMAASTPFSMPPTAGEQTTTLAQPSQATDTLMQIAFPAQNPTVVAQTPSWEVQPRHSKVELTQPGQAQVAVALNGQHTAKPDQGLPTARTQFSTPSGVVSSSLNAGSKILPDSPSIERQLAELMADTWALQQQAVEIGRRLNYLSTCIQHALTSTPDEPDTNNKG